MSSPTDPYLMQPGFARVWPAARERAEDNGRITGRLTLPGVTATELDALGGLLGRVLNRSDDGSLRVGLDQLDRALRASRLQIRLQEVLEGMGGPLRDKPAERAAARTTLASSWQIISRHRTLSVHPELTGWLDRVRSTGLHTRAARGGDPFALLAACLNVLAALPTEPAEGLAAFAARTCPGGDTHALDRGRPMDVLCLSALTHLSDQPTPRSAGARREQWSAWGVICDELSVTVLTVGLSVAGDGYVERCLAAAAAVGEPRRLTLRELRGVSQLDVGPEVFVCENPEVVAAAATALGSACPPLVCTEGQPSVACLRLLSAVTATGSTLRVRCDLDPAGLVIASGLAARLPCRPWRMDAAAYGLTDDGLPWEGPAPNDAALAAAVAARGHVQLEEQPEILAALLADLRRSAVRPWPSATALGHLTDGP
ncbi:hypothetical protein DSM104299_04169 [Baekduia alba]|uniref:TIGR02679 family protein n=1 Tax=Baekduia alba TaxID=2997333 RepID=UPI002340A35A|nr:TIGR02679 family protein [Baekduia alba]WCB95426.1 hypothetical protein DSM104299_04169 [Baekduia alba]